MDEEINKQHLYVKKGIKKLQYIYTMEYHSAMKEKGKEKKTLLFATAWMDLENIMLSEISQPEEDKYHVILLIYGI